MSLSWISVAITRSVFAALVGATVRGGVLLVLAAAVVRLWPRASAAHRHMVWAVACCSLPLLPLLPLVLPSWLISVPHTAVAPLWHGFDEAGGHTVSRIIAAVDHGAAVKPSAAALQTRPEPTWLVVCLAVWVGGILVTFVALLISRRRVRRFVWDAYPLTAPQTLDVLNRATSALGLARLVPVKLTPSTVPMVYGTLRPTLLLPVSSCTWEEDRLYTVLLHELAHIRRYDCLIQTVAFFACALYWCNPLVWLAVRALQTEQEQACDDVVLSVGRLPRDYATDLLELAQAIQSTTAIPLATVPFARPSELQTRMQAILDRTRRRSRVPRWMAVTIWSAGLGVVSPLAVLTPRWGALQGLTLRHTTRNSDADRTQRNGKETGVAALHTPRQVSEVDRAQFVPMYTFAVRQLHSLPDSAVEILNLLRVETLRKYPELAQAIGEGVEAIQAGENPTPSLLRARHLLEGTASTQDTLPLWSGAW